MSDIGEAILRKLARVNEIIESLKYLLRAQQEGIPTKEIRSDLFDVEIRLYPVGEKHIKVVLRITPKKNISPDLLSTIYLSELAARDENTLLQNAIERRYKKMMIGGIIHLSTIINKELLKLEIKRILTKIKRAFIALTNEKIRAKILNEHAKLEQLLSDPDKNRREILITLMRLNEILLYEAPID